VSDPAFVDQFPDCQASKGDSLAQLADASARRPRTFFIENWLARGNRKMDSLFEQARGMCLDRAAVGGSLAGEFGLNLGSDVNGDGHVGFHIGLRPTVLEATPGVKIVQHNTSRILSERPLCLVCLAMDPPDPVLWR
jgi:hypothetical protein